MLLGKKSALWAPRGTTYFPAEEVNVPDWAAGGSNYTGLPSGRFGSGPSPYPLGGDDNFLSGITDYIKGATDYLTGSMAMFSKASDYSGTASESALVRKAQAQLNAIGAPELSVDGSLGPNTKAALSVVLGPHWGLKTWSGILLALSQSHGPFLYGHTPDDSGSGPNAEGPGVGQPAMAGLPLIPIALAIGAWFVFFKKKKKGKR